jgi:hypothetical protein
MLGGGMQGKNKKDKRLKSKSFFLKTAKPDTPSGFAEPSPARSDRLLTSTMRHPN